MHRLPILVEYGAWAWKLAALAAALVALAIGDSVRGRAEARRTKRDLARRRGEVSAPQLAKAEGQVALTGTLHGGIATTLTVGASAYHDCAGDLWIDYKGERLELGAGVRVVYGTSASAARALPRSTPRGIRDALAKSTDKTGSVVGRALQRAAGGRVHRLARVQQGDLVIARGVLAGQTGGVDRFGVRKWTLGPSSDTHEIELVAVAPASAAVPMRGSAALALAAVVAGATCGGLYLLGQRELDAGRARPTQPLDEIPGALDPLALACALPGSRAAALDELARRYPALRVRLDELRAK